MNDAKSPSYCIMAKEKIDKWWRWLCRNACLVSLGLAIATVLLTGYGVYLHESKPGNECSDPVDDFDLVSAVFYEAARIILLNMDTRLRSNPFIYLGRIFAVLLFIVLGIQALAKLLGDSWRNLWLFTYTQHHVVCGLGSIGWQLVQDLRTERKKVVVIEQNPANELCNDARRKGALVLIGDASDEEMLEHARVKVAETVYIVTGNDETNVEAADDVQKLLPTTAASSPAPKLPDCYVHIVEPAFADVLLGKLAVAERDRMRVTPFNVMRNSARNLIEEHLTCERPTKDEEVALYVIVGFGKMGRLVAEYLAELAHFENHKRARLLILTDKPAVQALEFLSRWGQFSPCVVANQWDQMAFDPLADQWGCRKQRPGKEFWVNDPLAIEYACNAVFAPLPAHLGERSFLDALVPLLQEKHVKPAIIVCMERERDGFISAVTLEQGIRRVVGERIAPVFAYLPKQPPLERLLTSSGKDKHGKPEGVVTPFGSCENELRLKKIVQPLEEDLAKAIMAGYAKLVPSAANEAKILEMWQADSEILRQSNRLAAAQKLIAFRCLGFEPIKKIEAEAKKRKIVKLVLTKKQQDQLAPGEHSRLLTDQEQETLAHTEHNRWVAERLLAGWSYGPRSDIPPRRPQIMTWADLGATQAEEKAKDFAQIQIVLNEIDRLKFVLVEVP